MESGVKKISTLTVLGTTMTAGCALLKDPAIGTWTMTSQANDCKTITDGDAMGDICFTFSNFDFTIEDELIATVDQIGGNLSSTSNGPEGSETYSDNFTMTGDMNVASLEEGYEIDVEGSFTLDGESYVAAIELNCTLTTNTELNCSLDDFILDGDETEGYVGDWEFTFTKQ